MCWGRFFSYITIQTFPCMSVSFYILPFDPLSPGATRKETLSSTFICLFPCSPSLHYTASFSVGGPGLSKNGPKRTSPLLKLIEGAGITLLMSLVRVFSPLPPSRAEEDKSEQQYQQAVGSGPEPHHQTVWGEVEGGHVEWR